MKKIIFLLLIVLLCCTRLYNLGWGHPFPFHPDENNMVRSIQGLECKGGSLKDCLNPHFFAYGQPPLYVAYVITKIFPIIDSRVALRLISALASIINALVLIKIFQLFLRKKSKITDHIIPLLIIIFSPYFIQFSHFGTTESTLMLIYSLLTYILLLVSKDNHFTYKRMFSVGVLLGLAVAIKLSSVLLIVPFICVLLRPMLRKQSLREILVTMKVLIIRLVVLIIVSGVCYALFSPHNIISWSDFISSMKYEIGVGSGSIKVFYTQQFEGAQPVLFQMLHIFPYVLGLPQFFIALFGMGLMIMRRTFQEKILLLSICAFLIPNAFLYAKWTRFMSPIFPLLTISVLIGIQYIYDYIFEKSERKSMVTYFLYAVLLLISLLPGVAYFSIYTNKDVRIEASEWINNNIPRDVLILSEAGNVVDIPMHIYSQSNKNIEQGYQIISFDFYTLDKNSYQGQELQHNMESSKYIFVPSRRVFANYTCLSPDKLDVKGFSKDRCDKLQNSYPLLSRYYQKIFNDKESYALIKTFTSYPRIPLSAGYALEFPDEAAEETWTVFDHPVIRIYKKI